MMQRRQEEQEFKQAKAAAQAQIQAVRELRIIKEHQEAHKAARAQIEAVRNLRIKKENDMDTKLEGMISPPVVKFSLEQQMQHTNADPFLAAHPAPAKIFARNTTSSNSEF